MKPLRIKDFSWTYKQQLIAKFSVSILLAFGLGFSFGRQSTVQQRTALESSSAVSNETNPTEYPNSETSVAPFIPTSTIAKRVDPLTDQVQHTFNLISSNDIVNTIGTSDRDTLIVRCKPGEVAAYISTTPFVSSNGQTVKLRWDDGVITSEWWNPATGGSALFSDAPISLLNKMASSKKLVISYKPYSKTAISAVFEFDHSQADLKRMQEVCQ